jgi:hypothetical protein
MFKVVKGRDRLSLNLQRILEWTEEKSFIYDQYTELPHSGFWRYITLFYSVEYPHFYES